MLGHEELSKAAILVFANKQVRDDSCRKYPAIPLISQIMRKITTRLLTLENNALFANFISGRKGMHVHGGDLKAAEPAVHPETQVPDPALLRPHRRRVREGPNVRCE